jgi:hypothetical protein
VCFPKAWRDEAGDAKDEERRATQTLMNSVEHGRLSIPPNCKIIAWPIKKPNRHVCPQAMSNGEQILISGNTLHTKSTFATIPGGRDIYALRYYIVLSSHLLMNQTITQSRQYVRI